MKDFKELKSVPMANTQQLRVNEMVEPLDLSSPAIFVMTDFTRRSPKIIDEDTSVDEALLIMRKSHNKSKLVVTKNLTMLGIVNMADLLSRKVLMAANKKGISRQDVTVNDLMVKLTDLHAVRYEKIVQSCIGDVLTTMRAFGEQHLLVLDGENNLRGMISAVDISRSLHIPLDISVTAHSFKDVFNVIHEHTELN